MNNIHNQSWFFHAVMEQMSEAIIVTDLNVLALKLLFDSFTKQVNTLRDKISEISICSTKKSAMNTMSLMTLNV